MQKLDILCDEYDFGALEGAFEGEFTSDCPLLLEITFLDEAEIRVLNKSARGIDDVTDVLSFPALEGIFKKPIRLKEHKFDVDEEGRLFLGSIAICPSRASEQAEEYGHSVLREIFYLAVHGICHLLGYDHMTEADKRLMRAKEERVLAKLNITRDSK